MEKLSQSEAAAIRMSAHINIFSAVVKAGDSYHVIARPGERGARPKCKMIVAVRDKKRAEELRQEILKIVEDTRNELKEKKFPTNFEYNIKFASVFHDDILLSESRAYKQTRHTGFRLLENCKAVFDQAVSQVPSRAEYFKKQKEDFIRYYYDELEKVIVADKNYYIIQDTGKNYRMTYYGLKEGETELHRIQSSVGDVFIMYGISKMNIRSSRQKTRTDKTDEKEYIFRSDLFSIKPKKLKTDNNS